MCCVSFTQVCSSNIMHYDWNLNVILFIIQRIRDQPLTYIVTKECRYLMMTFQLYEVKFFGKTKKITAEFRSIVLSTMTCYMTSSDVFLNGSRNYFNPKSECRISEIGSKMTEYELRPRSSNNISVCFFTDVSIFIFFYPECKNSDIGLNLRFAPLDAEIDLHKIWCLCLCRHRNTALSLSSPFLPPTSKFHRN
jgi:hypothetical protein